MEYLNQFYSEKSQGSKPYYNTENYQLIEYKGCQISKRSDIEFHVIKNEICIGMYAGINGAKDFIDTICKIEKCSKIKRLGFDRCQEHLHHFST